MSKLKSVYFIDSQSYNNLEIYDQNLLINIDCEEKILLGNSKLKNRDISNFEFKELYNYSDKNFFLKIISYFLSQIRLLFILSRNKPDIIHFQWFKIPHLDYVLLKIIKLLSPKSKIIYTAHNILPHDTGNKYKKIYKKIYNLVDGIIVHTKDSKAELFDHFNIKKTKIKVIPHGLLELDYNKIKTKKIADEFVDSNKLYDKLILGFLGIIRKNKGIDLLLDVLENDDYFKNNKNITFIIAGSCDNQRLNKRLQKISDFNNVIIDIRFLPIDNFAAYLKISDIILLPYTNISQSGVLLSVLAEEKPVIVSNRGGLTDPFEIGKIGWIIEPTKNNLDKVLKTVINNQKDVKEIKKDKKLWKKIKEYYSWKDIGETTKKFYEKIYYDFD